MTAGQEPTVQLTLTINGRSVTSERGPATPLLYVLRNDLGLKGARFGCGLGQCGACTVIVGDQARTSCDLAVGDVGDRPIRTIEALAEDGALHPVQQALVDEGAGQCGYCLSGIVMAIVALLESEPDANNARIRSALATNLCRCGAQARIVRAALRAAVVRRAPR